MSSCRKTAVALSEIDPSADNPREDFGDIEALADRIRATGGELINPIVVVRDGGRYRIVDGERRYRALLSIYGELGRADVLCFDSYSEAHAVVAMLATDDKKPLTSAERGRGFQTMMRLDVPVEAASNALGLEVRDVLRARRSLSAARKLAEDKQASLDAMIAAGGDDFSESERERILASKWPDAEASEIRQAHARAVRLEHIREAVGRALAGQVEFITRDERHEGGLKSLAFTACVHSVKEARLLEGEPGAEYVAAPPMWEREVPCWDVYRRTGQGEGAESPEEAKAARAREELEVHRTLMREVRTSMMEWLLWQDMQSLHTLRLRPLCEACVARRHWADPEDYDLDEGMADRLAGLRTARPSIAELVAWLDARVGDGAMPSAWRQRYEYVSGKSDQSLAEAWDVMVACGWEPDDAHRAVRAALVD